MEVRIGVQNVARELVFESAQEGDEITAAVTEALTKGGTLQLKDEKGRLLVVPVASLGYVDIGASEVRKVGFGLS
ncbi:DUF3107 family protein [Kineococcus sp. R8]|uniref:DUF3107 family protein n=1 Tax=Kineococcus siccus TaxID=2696567 RepID=UPI0014121A33|nr:DUF3107 family protein [Kineococcus siccus]